LALLGAQAQPQAGQETVAQQAIPDAPKPQVTLPDLRSVAPGQGTTSTSDGDATPDVPAAAAKTTPTTTAAPAPDGQNTYVPPQGQGADAIKTYVVHVDAVDVPFTVKDSKGKLVFGLLPRDVQVFENGASQHIDLFTTDSLPLSVALVIDQSMTQEEMDKVNAALGSLQNAFTPYDEIAVFTYNKRPKVMTDFTGAQSARLTQAVERSKGSGRETLMPGSLSGPMAQTTVINDQNVDPNTAAVRGHTGMALDTPREVHPLNDAILAAAIALSTRPLGRRRVIYVISDGKEFGSEAHTAQVIKYLLTNGIEVDGTLVGDSALPVVGKLDRMHLPLMMRDNALITYQKATAGQVDAEFMIGSIEKSFGRIAEEVRTRYTVGYTTHEPFIDGKYRKLEVRIMGHGNDLTVLAKDGYWPAAMEIRPRTAVPASAAQ